MAGAVKPPSGPLAAPFGGLNRADAIMLFCAILFGSSFPFAKPLMRHLDGVFYAGTRYLLAAGFLFAVVLALRQRPLVTGMDWKRVLECAAIFGLFQSCWAIALGLTNASLGAVFIATSPVFGALLATLGGQRLRPLGWLGIAIAFAGVFLVINNSFAAVTIGFDSLAADALWLFNAFLWALFAARSVPLVMNLGAARSFAWIMLLGALLILPLGLYLELRDGGVTMPPILWLNFLYTALITGAAASLLWNMGLQRLGITRTMIYMYLVPVFAILFAVAFLGEAFGPPQALGTVAVLGGVALTRRAAG